MVRDFVKSIFRRPDLTSGRLLQKSNLFVGLFFLYHFFDILSL